MDELRTTPHDFIWRVKNPQDYWADTLKEDDDMKNYILTLSGIIAFIALISACFCRAHEHVYNTNPDNKWQVHDAVMISAVVVILLIMITAIL